MTLADETEGRGDRGRGEEEGGNIEEFDNTV